MDEAIYLQKEVLTLLPPSNAVRSVAFNNLAGAIRLRADNQGHPKDLDDVIELFTEAFALPSGSWNLPYLTISELDLSSLSRARRRLYIARLTKPVTSCCTTLYHIQHEPTLSLI
jgi:hypothetical protein